MTDKCPLHDEVITDIKEDIKEVKSANEEMVKNINSRVSNRLLYVLLGVAMTIFTFFGGAQMYSSRSLSEDVKEVSESVIEIKTNQKHFKEQQKMIKKDVEDIKKNVNGK